MKRILKIFSVALMVGMAVPATSSFFDTLSSSQEVVVGLTGGTVLGASLVAGVHHLVGTDKYQEITDTVLASLRSGWDISCEWAKNAFFLYSLNNLIMDRENRISEI